MARAADQGRGESTSILSNASSSLLVKLITSAFTAVLTIFLARYLGPSDYGLFALAVSVGALVALPSDFGITASAARFVAERRSDRDATVNILSDALTLKLLASGLVSILLATLAEPVAHAYGEPDLAWPIRGIAISLLGQNVMFLYFGAFSALRRTPLQLRVMFSESAVETGATIALVLLGGGATGATFGRSAGYTVGGLAGVLVAFRLFGRGILPRRTSASGDRRAIAGYAGALFLIDSAFTAFEQIDILLIGGYLSAAAVGVFQAPLRLVAFLQYPGQALASAIAPRMVRTADDEPDTAAFIESLRLLVVLHLGLATGILVWAQPIADLVLGDDYRGAGAVLRSLTPYIFLAGLGPLVSLSVNYAGRARARVPIAVVTVAINLVLDIILIPRIGVVAGGIATGAAYLVYVPAHMLLCRELFGLRLSGVAMTLARTIPAAGALAAVLAFAGTEELSAVGWLLGGAGGALAFLAVCALTGALTRRDLRWVRARLSF
jgi:O-antigen/teichoic acid export membrane protein